MLTMTGGGSVVQHLISPATLAVSSTSAAAVGQQLSVMTYNILLPNSVDGWWMYKMFSPTLSLPDEEYQHISSWEYRRGLLKDRIGQVNADIVCLQEVSPTSFDDDFNFMVDLGYDGHEMFKKGRFRPVTFWKTSQCRLASPPVHKDRCLITAFQKYDPLMADDTDDNDERPVESPLNWYVVNCHLQAGVQAPRRVRQIQEAMKGVVTLARKLLKQEETIENPEETVRVIVCGDFNGEAESGAINFLEKGFIDETFIEDGEPVSSGRKELPLPQPLLDVSAAVDGRSPPPTLVVSEFMSNLMDNRCYDHPVMSQSMKDRLERIYKTLATSADGQMNRGDVEQWLIRINQRVGRGDEFRNAAIEMGWVDPNLDDDSEVQKKRVQLPDHGVLTLEGFQNVYQKELEGGKFWGIGWDMKTLGDPLPDVGLFRSRYDRIYYNGVSMYPVAVLDTTSDQPCPNQKEPSDHLPVAALFQAKT